MARLVGPVELCWTQSCDFRDYHCKGKGAGKDSREVGRGGVWGGPTIGCCV